MKTISACSIVQDEQDTIQRLIDHLFPYVDEMIIVDGGSVDRTLELIAKEKYKMEEILKDKCKIKLFIKPFEFHFANQKNYALEQASCDWVLWIDADELYQKDALESLQRLIKIADTDKIEAFQFPRQTRIDGCLHNITEPDFQIRFWKNNKKIKFSGKLHESPFGFSKLVSCNMWIEHNKTAAQQQKDNETYWDMGQERPDIYWKKVDGKWIHKVN